MCFVICLTKCVGFCEEMTAMKAVAHHLYPKLEATPLQADVMRPFTDEQLRTLYYSYELEHTNEFIDSFLQVFVVNNIFATMKLSWLSGK